MDMIRRASPGDIQLANYSLVMDQSKKLVLRKMAHDTIRYYRISHVLQLCRLLSKWTNFLPLKVSTADPTVKPTRGLHWNPNDGKLYVLDLASREMLPFCWMNQCGSSCEDNEVGLCAHHAGESLTFLDALERVDIAQAQITIPESCEEANNNNNEFPWGIPEAARVRNLLEEAFSVLLNKAHRSVHPFAEKVLYVREDYNMKMSDCVSSYLMKEGSVTVNGIKIAFSLVWDCFIYKFPNSSAWERKCADTICFLPAHTMHSECEIHRDKSAWKQIILNRILMLAGVCSWNDLTEDIIESVRDRLFENGHDYYEDTVDGTQISFEAGGEIFLHRQNRVYRICNGYVNGCQNILGMDETCKACTTTLFYVPFVLRSRDGKHFYVGKVTQIYSEADDKWKTRAKKNLSKIVARFNKANTVVSKNDFVPLRASDFDFWNMVYCGESCCFKWSLVATGALGLYIAYEAALLRKNAIFVHKRLYVAPNSSVFLGFGRILQKVGLEFKIIEDGFEFEACPNDRVPLLDFYFDVNTSGYTARTYRATNIKTKMVYVGLWQPSPHEERVKDKTIAPIHFRYNDKTNYQKLFGDATDIVEERLALVKGGASPMDVETICILAEKFGSEVLFNGNRVLNNWIERMPVCSLNWFDQLRQSISILWGKTFEILKTDQFTPIVWENDEMET